MQDLKHETAIAVAKTTPALVGSVWYKMSLNEWVAICTIGYILIQAAIILHKHYYFIKNQKD